MATPQLADEVRARLPIEAQRYIAALEDQVSAFHQEVAELRRTLRRLQEDLGETQAQLRQNSENSSRPPSSDLPSASVGARPARSGRRRGGQAGHPGHTRTLLAPEDVDRIMEHRPESCPHCQGSLAADLPDAAEVQRQQVWEIPPVAPVITEHRYHTVTCPQCQQAVRAARPAEVPPGAFGPQVTALAGLLHGRYRLSARESGALLRDVFGIPVALGSMPRLWQDVSAALAQPTAEVQAAVTSSASTNVDETGWKEAGQRRWLWVAVSALGTVFLVAAHRSAAVLQTVLGPDFCGIVGSDRFTAYLAVPVERRQVCWAHLQRNFRAVQERDGPAGRWGSHALDLVAQIFAAWAQFQDGTLDRAGLQAAMQPTQAALHTLLEHGAHLPLPQARALSQDLLTLWPALWTFVTVEGVEPTNNAAERALRPAVLWRKGCFGADSAAGNVFVARLLTVGTTCRQHQRPLLAFLTAAVAAHWAGVPGPSLLPAP